MQKLTNEDLGKLVKNMFCIDAGEEPIPFGDDYLDFFSETVCGRVGRDIELSDRQSKVGKKGGAPKGNKNASKTSQNQPKNNPNSTQKQPKTSPNTNTNTNIYIHKKNNSFVDSCLKRDIDFDDLENKVVKN